MIAAAEPHATPSDGTVWPPDRFFWAMSPLTFKDVSSVIRLRGDRSRKARPMPIGLREDLAQQIPIAVDDVHAVVAVVPGGGTLICAARKSDLAAVRNQTMSLAPSRLPEWIGGSFAGVDATQLNVLIGNMEPESYRQRRRRTQRISGLILLLAAVLLLVGLKRRAEHWATVTASVQDLQDRRIASVQPEAPSVDVLDQHLQAWRLFSQSARMVPSPQDQSLQFVEALRHWPCDDDTWTLAITIGDDDLNAEVLVAGDPASALAGITPPGWVLHEPVVTVVPRGRRAHPSETYRVTLRLTHAPSTSGGIP